MSHHGDFTSAIRQADPQTIVNDYFRREAVYWEQIYRRPGIKEAIHQERLRVALGMAASLGLPARARALDIGCGAGFATVGLARQGFRVDALDPVPDMVQATRARALKAGLGSRVTPGLADVHALPFPDATFDLVVALGVLPWLPGIDGALREMARVLRPGGHVIATIDARWQLRQTFDPLLNPVFEIPRRWAARLLGRQAQGVRAHTMSVTAFRRALAHHGFAEVNGVALGFGPFTFCKREVLPPVFGLRLHVQLQALADRGTPILRAAGSQYLVLAQKRPATPDRARSLQQ